MLVVDHDALETIDLLDFVHEVARQRLDAPDGQDVVRCRVAVEDVVALLDDVAFLQMERLALRDQVLDRLDAILVRLDDDAALVLVVASEPHRAVDLRDDRVVLRLAGLEQLGDARQTARDVLGLRAFHRNTRENVTGTDRRTRLDREDGVHRQEVAGVGAARELGDRAVLGADHDGRLQVGTAGLARQSMT